MFTKADERFLKAAGISLADDRADPNPAETEVQRVTRRVYDIWGRKRHDEWVRRIREQVPIIQPPDHPEIHEILLRNGWQAILAADARWLYRDPEEGSWHHQFEAALRQGARTSEER